MKKKTPNSRRKLLVLIFALIFHCHSAFGMSAKPVPLLQSRIIRIAQSEIGRGETTADDRGEDILKYFDENMQRSWCCAFVQWVLGEAGVDEFRGIYSSRAFWERAKELGWTVKRPEPGDIVVWWRTHKTNSNHGHIGIVEYVQLESKDIRHGDIQYADFSYVITTIEGNVGEFPAKVKRCSHRTTAGYGMRNLLGYVRIPNGQNK